MGGSGGHRSGPSISMEELFARAHMGTEQHQYETAVEELLREHLKDFNDRDVDAIRRHLSTLQKILSEEIEGTVELMFGGSVNKHTYVNGLSDVDMLVCLNGTSLENKNPNQVFTHFAMMLSQKLPGTEVTRGDLAITVKFSDGHEIQLLPAKQTTNGCRIAEPGKNKWSNVIRPDAFAEKLTQVNQASGGKVVPLIKLLKPMNEKLSDALRLSGYHIESLAIQAFNGYKGRPTFREMIKHFWNRAQTDVLSPLKDSTGQSRHVDDYLGEGNSEVRKQVSRAIGRIITKIERSDNLGSTNDWQELLET